MKLLVVSCGSGTEIVELRRFVDNTPGLKWVRVYRRADATYTYYHRENKVTQGVVACSDDAAEFKLRLCFHVVSRTPV